MTQPFAIPYTLETYEAIRRLVLCSGFAEDYTWSQTVQPPEDPDDFALELAFVICNSGMAARIARPIFVRVREALLRGESAATAYGHAAKAEAIDTIWAGRATLLEQYRRAGDKITFLRALPWIGPITCFHAAKNFGLDVCKPDVHLQRIADAHGETPQGLCERLAGLSGDRIATVDLILWRAAERGIINTRELVGT